VPGEGSIAPAQNATGAFTTWSQTAKVTFTEIRILNDSDDGSSGELTFLLTAWGTGQQAELGEGDPLNWDAGLTHAIASEPLIENAPDRIRLRVCGRDDDYLFKTSAVAYCEAAVITTPHARPP
jgi:hypothetical protein